LLFDGVLFIGVGFQLHGEVMLLTMFGGDMRFLMIGCREKKVNGFGKIRKRESVTRVKIDMIAVGLVKEVNLKKLA